MSSAAYLRLAITLFGLSMVATFDRESYGGMLGFVVQGISLGMSIASIRGE